MAHVHGSGRKLSFFFGSVGGFILQAAFDPGRRAEDGLVFVVESRGVEKRVLREAMKRFAQRRGGTLEDGSPEVERSVLLIHLPWSSNEPRQQFVQAAGALAKALLAAEVQEG